MKKINLKTFMHIVSIVSFVIGFTLIIWKAGWIVALGIFIVLIGLNADNEWKKM